MQHQSTLSICNFQELGSRQISADFQGGHITSDAGGLLLKHVNEATQLIAQFAKCFSDFRDPDRVEHTVEHLVAQRVFGLALGYEDINDHDLLRSDQLLAVLVGKTDLKGARRRRARDRGKALAGKSTLNRLELTPEHAGSDSRYKKTTYHADMIDRLMVKHFLDSHAQAPQEIILDVDATDDLIHGNQEGRFFHGYYRNYCYLPLMIFCGDHLLCARLRPANIDASKGTVKELKPIVEQIRQRMPHTRIVLRADSGFARDDIFNWCEENNIKYVIGLAKNSRLQRLIEPQAEQARLGCLQTQKAARLFSSFSFRTRSSWTRSRRVVAKAEHLPKGANPRFVVTNLDPSYANDAVLYKTIYCGRGDMENRIKEVQLALFSDRTSTATLRGNQLRLYFSGIAYILMTSLRRMGLAGTKLAKAQAGTIRTKLLKIGAIVKVTVRRVWISLSSAYPHQSLFHEIIRNIRAYPGQFMT